MTSDATEMSEREKHAAFGRLARGVAHELRNPLGVILGRLQLLRMGIASGKSLEPEQLEKGIAAIEQQANRALEFIQMLSSLFRPRSPALAPVDPGQLVSEAVDVVRARVSLDRVELRNEIPNPLPPIPGDRAELRQVLANLLTNAVEAMPQGGRVTVTAGIGGSGATASIFIGIADTGPGLPAEDRGRIFDPFFTTKEGAKGLGLSWVQSVVRNHGGRIHVESEPGGGSRFTLTLPAGSGEALASGRGPVRDG